MLVSAASGLWKDYKQKSKLFVFQALMKSATGAVPLDLQGGLAGPAVHMPSRCPVPCKSSEAALEGDSNMA